MPVTRTSTCSATPARPELGTPLGRAMSSFLAAVIGTGLQWRDTAQAWMPAFQARIAVVRQRSYEGGNNLFMTTDDIASLALRGVVAGMRLRRRFASDAQWERQQWLRLRVAAESLAGFSDRLRVSLREQAYARLIPTPRAGEPWDVLDAIRDQLAGHADPNPPVAPPEAPDPRGLLVPARNVRVLRRTRDAARTGQAQRATVRSLARRCATPVRRAPPSAPRLGVFTGPPLVELVETSDALVSTSSTSDGYWMPAACTARTASRAAWSPSASGSGPRPHSQRSSSSEVPAKIPR